jgi:dolichyl-phosphate-mannose-protein mannosyltransferase
VTRAPWYSILTPVVLVAAAGVARFVLLGQPDGVVFDETYYVDDARSQLAHGAEEGFAVHPPLGKWLIAGGIALLGDTPFGWRAAAATAGTLVVLLTYLTARALLTTIGAAALAGLLVAVDGLLVVQSRIAMLDIFLALFIVLGAWLLVLDRARPAGREVLRPFLLLAGAAFGFAVATKWSGLLALGAAGAFVLGAELARRRRTRGGVTSGALRLVAVLAVAFVIVPTTAYAATWGPWLAGYAHTHQGAEDCVVDDEVVDPCPVSVGERIAGLVRHHGAMWRFHIDLDAEHPYKSRAWTWPLMTRAIVYHWESCPPDRATPDPEAEDQPEPCVVEEGNAEEILAIGNPALWWVALLALIPLALGALRRDGRALLILCFWASLYVPWLIIDRPLFLFYMTPVVPFMALGVAYALVRSEERGIDLDGATSARRSTWIRVVAAGLATVAVGLFVYFLPVWLGLEVPESVVRQRWWFDGWI